MGYNIWTFDPSAYNDEIQRERERTAAEARVSSRISPTSAFNAAHIIRNWPALEPDVITASSLAGIDPTAPSWQQIQAMGVEQQRGWFDRNVMSVARTAFRWADVGAQTLYENMPHTRGLRAVTGMAQGMSPTEAWEQARGDIGSEIAGAVARGQDWTLGDGWFTAPQDPWDSEEYRTAFNQHVAMQKAQGIEDDAVDYDGAHQFALRLTPVDVAGEAREGATRIQLQSHFEGSDPVPVSVGGLLMFQVFRPGTAPYMLASGITDFPFRIGADPLNIPFWAAEEINSARKILTPARNADPGVVYDISRMSSVPPDITSGGVKIRGESYPDYEVYAARHQQLSNYVRDGVATEADLDQLRAMGGPDAEGMHAKWRDQLTIEGRPETVHHADTEDMARALEQVADLPTPLPVLASSRFAEGLGQVGPRTLVDNPMSNGGGWAVLRGIKNRLNESAVEYGARMAAKVRTEGVALPLTVAEREELLLVGTADQAAMSAEQTDRVASILDRVTENDVRWLDSQLDEMERVAQTGRDAYKTLYDMDRSSAEHEAWRLMGNGDDELRASQADRRIAELENNLGEMDVPKPRAPEITDDTRPVPPDEVRELTEPTAPGDGVSPTAVETARSHPGVEPISDAEIAHLTNSVAVDMAQIRKTGEGGGINIDELLEAETRVNDRVEWLKQFAVEAGAIDDVAEFEKLVPLRNEMRSRIEAFGRKHSGLRPVTNLFPEAQIDTPTIRDWAKSLNYALRRGRHIPNKMRYPFLSKGFGRYQWLVKNLDHLDAAQAAELKELRRLNGLITQYWTRHVDESLADLGTWRGTEFGPGGEAGIGEPLPDTAREFQDPATGEIMSRPERPNVGTIVTAEMSSEIKMMAKALRSDPEAGDELLEAVDDLLDRLERYEGQRTSSKVTQSEMEAAEPEIARLEKELSEAGQLPAAGGKREFTKTYWQPRHTGGRYIPEPSEWDTWRTAEIKPQTIKSWWRSILTVPNETAYRMTSQRAKWIEKVRAQIAVRLAELQRVAAEATPPPIEHGNLLPDQPVPGAEALTPKERMATGKVPPRALTATERETYDAIRESAEHIEGMTAAQAEIVAQQLGIYVPFGSGAAKQRIGAYFAELGEVMIKRASWERARRIRPHQSAFEGISPRTFNELQALTRLARKAGIKPANLIAETLDDIPIRVPESAKVADELVPPVVDEAVAPIEAQAVPPAAPEAMTTGPKPEDLAVLTRIAEDYKATGKNPSYTETPKGLEGAWVVTRQVLDEGKSVDEAIAEGLRTASVQSQPETAAALARMEPAPETPALKEFRQREGQVADFYGEQPAIRVPTRDPQIEAELQYWRQRRAELGNRPELPPEPTLVTGDTKALKAQVAAGRQTADEIKRLRRFRRDISPKPAGPMPLSGAKLARAEAYYTQKAEELGHRRPFDVQEFAEEMGLAPSVVERAGAWLRDIGLLTPDPVAAEALGPGYEDVLGLAPLSRGDVDAVFDYLTELNIKGPQVAELIDDPETYAKVIAMRRERIAGIFEAETKLAVNKLIESPGGVLTGRYVDDLEVMAGRVARANSILRKLPLVILEATSHAIDQAARLIGIDPATADINTLMGWQIGFNPDEYAVRLTERVEAWAAEMALDYDRIDQITSMARSLAVDKADVVEIGHIAQELVDARMQGVAHGPLGAANQYEEAILTGSDKLNRPDAFRKDLRNYSRYGTDKLRRRPWQPPADADAQLDSVRGRKLVSFIAGTDNTDAIIRITNGALPVPTVRRLVAANDPAAVRTILRGEWGRTLRTMPKVTERLHRRITPMRGQGLNVQETDRLVYLLSRQRHLDEAQLAELGELSLRRQGMEPQSGLSQIWQPSRHHTNDLPGATVLPDDGTIARLRRRWLAEGGSANVILDPENIPKTILEVGHWLDTIGATPQEVASVQRKILFAGNDLESFVPIENQISDIFERRLGEEYGDEETVKEIMGDWHHARLQQQNFQHDAAGGQILMWDDATYNAFGGEDAKLHRFGSVNPIRETQFSQRNIILPSRTDVRRVLGETRKVRDKVVTASRRMVGNEKKAVLGLERSFVRGKLNNLMSGWRALALWRIGWPIKMTMDELLRMAADGYAYQMSPIRLMGLQMGKGDLGLMGTSIREEAQLMDGLGTGLHLDPDTLSPGYNTRYDMEGRNWEVIPLKNPRAWAAHFGTMKAMHESVITRTVAQLGVEDAYAYFRTPGGRRQLAPISADAEVGSAMSKIAQGGRDGDSALLHILQANDADIRRAAGGTYRYRQAILDKDGNRSLGEWMNQDGTLADPRQIPRLTDKHQQFIPGTDGNPKIWELISKGFIGDFRPGNSTWGIIHDIRRGATHDNYRYYPKPRGTGIMDGVGKLNYQVDKIVDSFDEAVAIADAGGPGGRVALIPEGEAKRARDTLTREPEWPYYDFETEPINIGVDAVRLHDEGKLPDALELEKGTEAEIYFDVASHPNEMDAMVRKLSGHWDETAGEWVDGVYPRIEVGVDRRGKPTYESTAPAFVKAPVTERKYSASQGRQISDHIYRVFGEGPTLAVSREPFLAMLYWEEAARYYLFAPDAIRAEMKQMAGRSGISGVFDQIIDRQLRSHGLKELPTARLDDITMTEINDAVMHHSQAKVRDLLYDLTRTGNIMDAARLMIPFGDAWWEVLTRWTRLLNPLSGGGNPQALKNWRRMQVTVDEMKSGGWFQEDEHGNDVFAVPTAFSFGVSDVALGFAFDPKNMAFIDPSNPTAGGLPGTSFLLQIPAAFIQPQLASVSPEFRDWVNQLTYGEFSPPETDVGGIFRTMVTTPWRRTWEALSNTENDAALGDDIASIVKALHSSGDPRYDYRTAEGRRNAYADAQKGGTVMTWGRLLMAFVSPGSPRWQAYLRVVEGWQDGEITYEWMNVASYQAEYRAAIDVLGSRDAAINYMLKRRGPDPLAAGLPKTFESIDRPEGRSAWDHLQAHPEIETYAPTTAMAFLPPDETGDFFPQAFQDALNNDSREIIRADQVGQAIAVSGGYDAQRYLQSKYDEALAELLATYPSGSEGYRANKYNLDVWHRQEVEKIQMTYFNGNTSGVVAKRDQPVSHGQMLTEARMIGRPNTEENLHLVELMPEMVEFLRVADDLYTEAERMTREIDPRRSLDWWRTSAYGPDSTSGEAAEADPIKKWVLENLLIAAERVTDPDQQRGVAWYLEEVFAPSMSGYADEDWWIPPEFEAPPEPTTRYNPTAADPLLATQGTP